MGGVAKFKAYEQYQGVLLPAFVGDALDPADPVFFVDDAVEGMDLAPFEERYSVLGEHPFPPRLLLKLWLFAAIAGVYSGREIARRLYWDLRYHVPGRVAAAELPHDQPLPLGPPGGVRGGAAADGRAGPGGGAGAAGAGGAWRASRSG